MRHALAAVLFAALALPAAAAARTYRAGDGFSIRAPTGYRLVRTAGGGHALTCGSAKVAFARYRTGRSPAAAGGALVRELGLAVLSRRASSGAFRATLASTTSSGTTRRAGVLLRRRGAVLEARMWVYTAGRTPCSGRAARTADLIDELGSIAGTAAGGQLASVQIKAVQAIDNAPVPEQRYEVCSNNVPPGQPPCTSALVPEAWFPYIGASPGEVEGVGVPSTGQRGEFVLGGVSAVYQPTCGTPISPNPGQPQGFYPDDPARAIEQIHAQQRHYAALATGRPDVYPIPQNVRVVATLRFPWIQLPGPNGLYLVRWTEDGRPWTAIFGSAIDDSGADACYWTWYFSFIAAPDNGAPGVPTALALTWASWRNSYQPVAQLRARAGGDPAQAQAQAPTPEIIAGRAPGYKLRRHRVRLMDFRAVLP